MQSIGFTAILLGGLISGANWVYLYQSWRTKRFVSSIPLIGALLLLFGLCQFKMTRPYAWIAIIADYGTLVFIYSFPHLCREFWSTSRFNLIREYVGSSDTQRYNLKLYKKGIFVIRSEVDPPQPANEHGAQISSFGFQGKWNDSEDEIKLSEYAEDRILNLKKTNDKLTATELNYPQDREYKYDLLNGIEFTLK